MSDLGTRITRLENTLDAIQAKFNKITQNEVYPYISRTEFNNFSRRMTTAVHSVDTRLDTVEDSLEANTMYTLTQQEAEALKSGAARVASVQADWRAVVAEIETLLNSYESATNINNSALARRIGALETTMSDIEGKADYLNASYGTLVGTVNALKRQYITQQGVSTVNTSTGKLTVSLSGFTNIHNFIVTTSIRYGSQAGVFVQIEQGNENFVIHILDSSGNHVDCSGSNVLVHWAASKMFQ
jgi:hypothetical protein